MADEPRRSGRATKGQYTKERDIDDAPPAKKGKGKGAKAKQVEEPEEEEGEDELIRCVCGTYEEEEDVPRAMICCDNCSAWQHNDCMGLPEDYEVDKYFCEQCRPQDHKELLAAIKRGEKPWEETAQKRAAAKAEKASKKKGGKRGRKSASKADEITAPEPTEEPEDTQSPPTAGQKRKAEESPTPADTKGNKKARGTPTTESNGARASSASRKPSNVNTPTRQPSKSEPSPAVATDVKELAASRKPAASSLIKLFVDQTKEAVKAGQFTLPSDANAQTVGTRLGLLVEHALYYVQSQGSGDPNDAYKNHLRAISFNVKKNHSLAVRLLNGELSPHGLAGMDPKDMASEEQQAKDAAIMKEMEKQHTIIEEQGPRIRRTHKGDEYVDESRQVAAESLTSKAPLRKQSMAEHDGEVKSPDLKSPTEASPFIPRTTSMSGPPKPRPSIDPKRKSSSNFDIDKVWSNVQGSPDAEQRFGELPQKSPVMATREPAAPGARADAEIDALLKEEDEAESPPYSPKDYADNEGTVWKGIVNGGNLGKFHASARYAAGATPDVPTLRMTWNQLIPAEIGINGRIQPAKADEYLCGLEYSQTSDLVIVSMREPENTHDREQFEKFFRYFKSKERFGVGIQHTNPAIKDIYFIPLDDGQELPAFVKKLETDFPDPAQERMLLVPIVVKNSELPHNIAAQDEAGAIQSPTDGARTSQTPIMPYGGGFEPPAANGAAIPYAQPAPQAQGTNGNPPPAQPYAQPLPHTASPSNYPTNQAPVASGPPAAAAAQRVLGPHASAPAVKQLIEQAPNAGDVEMGVVKECINENPEAANSLEVLTNMLHVKWGQTS